MANSASAVQTFNALPATARIGLGSAQFGGRYGATNRNAPPSPTEIARIIDRAAAAGVTWVDTAPGYGNAETVLGHVLASNPAFKVVTKVPPLQRIAHGNAQSVLRAAVESSLVRLRRDSIEVLLLHRAGDLARPDWVEIVSALQTLKSDGLIRRVGASVYDENELNLARTRLAPDVIQLPLSPLDRRFADAGLGRALLASGVVVHARSLFLQGLLVAPERDLPDFARNHRALHEWRHWLKVCRLSPLTACLAFALSTPHVELALIGVGTLGEFEDILRATQTLPTSVELEDLPSGGADLIDPRSWPSLQPRS